MDDDFGLVDLTNVQLPLIARPLCRSAIDIAQQVSGFRQASSLADSHSPLVGELLKLATGLNNVEQKNVIDYSSDILSLLMNGTRSTNTPGSSNDNWAAVADALSKQELELIAALAMPRVILSAIQQILQAEQQLLRNNSIEGYQEFADITNDAIAVLNETHQVYRNIRHM